jgi:hypothetical protein
MNKNMKKIILIVTALVLYQIHAMSAGRIAEIWTKPAIFKADEAVSFYFDVTGTGLDGVTEDIYLWSWFPSEPDAGNFTNSSAFAKLVHVEGNIWRMDMTPTEYYNVDASTITGFYGLLKNKDGSKVTDAFAPDQIPANDIKLYDLTTIKGSALTDYYPKTFTKDRPLSILVNTHNTWSNCETTAVQGDLATASNVHMEGGVNSWDIKVENNASNLAKTAMTSLGDGVYRMDLIIQDYFALPAGYDLQTINMIFADDASTHFGKGAACADFQLLAPDVPEVIPPELSFFPQKISKKDILVITRTNNEFGVTALHYKITVGVDEIIIAQGDFEGSNTSMSAYIDLVTPLKGIATVDKINVVITDNKGRIVTNTDINLVQLTN